MYKRKTQDEYIVEGDYGMGWEVVSVCATRKEARDDYKAYCENDKYHAYRWKKRRVKIETV